MRGVLTKRRVQRARAWGACALLGLAVPAAAQTPPATTGDTPRTAEVVAEVSTERTVIAVPAFATPAVVNVAGLSTGTLGRQIADVIAQISAEATRAEDNVVEVASVAEESSASAEPVSASTQEPSASTQELSASAPMLAGTAEHLNTLVRRFTLSG